MNDSRGGVARPCSCGENSASTTTLLPGDWARNVTPSLNQYLAGRTAPATDDADSIDAERTE